MSARFFRVNGPKVEANNPTCSCVLSINSPLIAKPPPSYWPVKEEPSAIGVKSQPPRSMSAVCKKYLFDHDADVAEAHSKFAAVAMR